MFEEEVAQLIRSWGYTAHTQVGAAGYRIDIGVLHPDRPGEYILAVECARCRLSLCADRSRPGPAA